MEAYGQSDDPQLLKDEIQELVSKLSQMEGKQMFLEAKVQNLKMKVEVTEGALLEERKKVLDMYVKCEEEHQKWINCVEEYHKFKIHNESEQVAVMLRRRNETLNKDREAAIMAVDTIREKIQVYQRAAELSRDISVGRMTVMAINKRGYTVPQNKMFVGNVAETGKQFVVDLTDTKHEYVGPILQQSHRMSDSWTIGEMAVVALEFQEITRFVEWDPKKLMAKVKDFELNPNTILNVIPTSRMTTKGQVMRLEIETPESYRFLLEKAVRSDPKVFDKFKNWYSGQAEPSKPIHTDIPECSGNRKGCHSYCKVDQKSPPDVIQLKWKDDWHKTEEED